jgi:hypothetical protein
MHLLGDKYDPIHSWGYGCVRDIRAAFGVSCRFCIYAFGKFNVNLMRPE